MMTDEAPFRSDANETLRLARNLQALAFQSPELVARIRQTKDVAFPAAKNGEPTCRIQQGEVFRWVHSAYDPGDEARRQALALAGDSERVVCIGGGLGYLPIALLDNPARRVVLLEPELMFSGHAWSVRLRRDASTKRLLIVTASSIDAKHVAALGDGWDDVPHPFILYEDRRRQLRFLSSVESAAARVLMVHSKLFTSIGVGF